MVAIIKTGHCIRSTFLYNENKLDSFILNEKGEKQRAAVLLMAANYPMDLERMTQQHRLNMLLKTAEKAPKCTRNSVHVSLNFAPGEDPSNDLLRQIAAEYMQKIGFGDQPYLCYRHYDAGHHHIHIVSVKVRPDGTRIDAHMIGYNLSEPARKELEQKYNLVQAEKHKRDYFTLKPVDVQKAVYGRTETKRAITNVLDAVLKTYRYSSLAGLNALLNVYNIHADRGLENSRTFQKSGLVYRILDDQGKPFGAPVKASHIYSKPTLKFLESRFKSAKLITKSDYDRVRNAIDFFFKKSPDVSIDLLQAALLKQNIRMVIRRNAEGGIYGVTYIDHRTKSVINGSALGSEYAANAIQRRCEESLQKAVNQRQAISPSAASLHTQNPAATHINQADQTYDPGSKNLLDLLMQSENVSEYLPHQLKKSRKKRKKRKPDNL